MASAAPFADLTFTVLVADAQDNVGFLDLQEIAVAETGNQELVVRYLIDTTVPSGGNANLAQDFFFSVDADAYSTGINAAGGSAGNGNFVVPPAKSCVLDGDYGYCVLGYEGFKGAVGTLLTATSAISYAGTAQDYAPATGAYIPFGVLGAKGSDYTLTGCTAVVCPVLGGAVLNVNVTAANLTVRDHFTNATSNATLYHWANTHASLDLTAQVAAGHGNVTYTIRDSANQTVANGTLHGNSTTSKTFAPAAVGNWTILVRYEAFQGSFNLTLAPPAPVLNTTSTTPTASVAPLSAPPQNATTSGTGTQATPGPGVVAIAGAIAMALVLRRRR